MITRCASRKRNRKRNSYGWVNKNYYRISSWQFRKIFKQYLIVFFKKDIGGNICGDLLEKSLEKFMNNILDRCLNELKKKYLIKWTPWRISGEISEELLP